MPQQAFKRTRTRQPQQAVRIAPQFASRAKFAFLPGMGFVNLAQRSQAINASGVMTKGVSASGVTYDAGTQAEFAVTLDPNKGLTFVSIWRARPSQYLFSDGIIYVLSSRTAGNSGWSWGRDAAVGGGANGNLTKQTFVLQGIGAYSEANSTLESLVDTPVACRYSKSAGLVSWFRFGRKTSVDNVASTSPGAGSNLVLGAQGPYATRGSAWLDRSSVVVAFEGELSDAEVFSVTKDTASVWQLFAPRTLVIPSSATVQLLRPVSDVSAGAWTPSSGLTLAPMLNEAVAVDSSFITVSSASTSEVAFGTGLSPGVTTGHTIRFRAQGTGGLTVRLMQGATIISSFSPTLTTAYALYAWTLSGVEAGTITNYAGLSLRFVST